MAQFLHLLKVNIFSSNHRRKRRAIAILVSLICSACSVATPQVKPPPAREAVLKVANSSDRAEAAFEARSLAIREKLAVRDLEKLDAWWRREQIGDPHKYLLPVILARLSLGERYDKQQIWNVLLNMDKDQNDLYHFRSIYDIRIFFLFRNIMPEKVTESYRTMVAMPRVREWMETGTENHMMMQRLSGLALMDGSGWENGDRAIPASIEAWLRSELNKFLTIGQGEFHSSKYYGYSIAGLLNLYDFGRTPELRQLAKAGLDWYAANMALRLSWGTAGGAESRGFDRGTWDSSELAGVAWVWWGDTPQVAQRMSDSAMRVGLLAALSKYRPPKEFQALARKEVPLPFLLEASHPNYYSYHQGNQLWETFYITKDYSLGTLLQPQRTYLKKGIINPQHATYKLAIRDAKGQKNAVISLAGTFHSEMATGSSPGDEYLQGRSAVIYQLILDRKDLAAGVIPRSHLVLPIRYGQPQRHKDWYIWRIENAWLCARPWGENISLVAPVSERYKNYQALAAIGNKTAWITDVASIADYPDFKRLTAALDRTIIDDREWENNGKIAYTGLEGDKLMMTYQPDSGIGRATINGKERILKNWLVLNSPYLRQNLNSGVLEYRIPNGDIWRLRATFSGPKWEFKKRS